jgi:hypothetical protein
LLRKRRVFCRFEETLGIGEEGFEAIRCVSSVHTHRQRTHSKTHTDARVECSNMNFEKLLVT